MKIELIRLLNESLEAVLEDKTKMIDKLVLPDIEDEDAKKKAKEEMKAFFKKYSNWENKLDWNKWKTLTYKEFQAIQDQASQTNRAQKKAMSGDVKNIFKDVGNRKFRIMGENDNWLFVSPLTREAAIYCDSSENQGAGAKWCIGMTTTNSHWNRYQAINTLFIMAFNKNYKNLSKEELNTKLKYMIQCEFSDYEHLKGNMKLTLWTQEDDDFEVKNKMTLTDDEFLKKMFEELRKEKKEDLEKKAEKANTIANEALKKLRKISYNTVHKIKELQNATKIEIPKKIKKIERGAFDAYTDLEKIVLPDTISEIDDNAFEGCTRLNEINLPNGIKRIGEYAFWCCYGLTNIEIPNSVEEIGTHAFGGCRLKSISIPKRFKEKMNDIFDNSKFTFDISKAKITFI